MGEKRSKAIDISQPPAKRARDEVVPFGVENDTTPALPVVPTEVVLPTPAATPAAKPRKVQDPNHPKRPMSSFLLFARETRAQTIKEHPELSYLEVTKLMAQMWEKTDKRPWEQKCDKLTDAYHQEVEEYRKKLKLEGKEVLGSEIDVDLSKKAKKRKEKKDKNPQDKSIELVTEKATEPAKVLKRKQKQTGELKAEESMVSGSMIAGSMVDESKADRSEVEKSSTKMPQKKKERTKTSSEFDSDTSVRSMDSSPPTVSSSQPTSVPIATISCVETSPERFKSKKGKNKKVKPVSSSSDSS